MHLMIADKYKTKYCYHIKNIKKLSKQFLVYVKSFYNQLVISTKDCGMGLFSSSVSQVNPCALSSSVNCYLLFYVQDGTGEVRESTPYPLETWSEALETQGKKSRKLTAVSCCFDVCWYFL